MSHSVSMQEAMHQFVCTGDACPDTCCQQWSMQVDEATVARYASVPGLQQSVEQGAHGEGWVMRRRADNGHCVKLEGGWCGVQKAHGAAMLGDACALYPRVTRALGERRVVSSTLSCPEIARLLLTQEFSALYHPQQVERVPSTIHDYLPQGMGAEDAMALHESCVRLVLALDVPPEISLMRLQQAARKFNELPPQAWQAALDEVSTKEVLPIPRRVAEDPFNLLHALCGLVMASGKHPSVRLLATTQTMEAALASQLDWPNVGIRTSDRSWERWQHVREAWYARHAASAAPALRRFLAAQLGFMLFPFAGFGGALPHRVAMLVVRFATVKLAWMCHAYEQGALDDETKIRVVQSIARALDHLSNPEYPLQVYASAGWTEEDRMSAIVQL